MYNCKGKLTLKLGDNNMKNKIISVLCLSIFSLGTLSACSDDTRVSSKEHIDTNTGAWTNIEYAGDKDAPVIGVNDIAVKPAPDNDPQLMDNPSAVQLANNNANRRINPNIETPTYVNQNEGYVDKPIQENDAEQINNQIAVAPDTQIDTAENEEEAKMGNSQIAQQNQVLVKKLTDELSGINEKLTRLGQNNEINRYNYKGKGEAKAVVSTEINNFNQRREKLIKDIAMLQQDKKDNYKLTRTYKMDDATDKNKAIHDKDKNIEQNRTNPINRAGTSNVIQ